MSLSVHMLIHNRPKYEYRFAVLALGTLLLQKYRDWTLYLIDDIDPERLDLSEALLSLDKMGVPVLGRGGEIQQHWYGNSDQVAIVPQKRNYALAVSHEDIVVNWDDDDLKGPEYLHRASSFMGSHPQVIGNFAANGYWYDLRKRAYSGPHLGIGSSNWFFRREWLDVSGLKYPISRHRSYGSDKRFMILAANQTPGFEFRRCHCKAMNLQMISLYHPNNLKNRKLGTSTADPKLHQLFSWVDPRLHPLLHEIAELSFPKAPKLDRESNGI